MGLLATGPVSVAHRNQVALRNCAAQWPPPTRRHASAAAAPADVCVWNPLTTTLGRQDEVSAILSRQDVIMLNGTKQLQIDYDDLALETETKRHWIWNFPRPRKPVRKQTVHSRSVGTAVFLSKSKFQREQVREAFVPTQIMRCKRTMNSSPFL